MNWIFQHQEAGSLSEIDKKCFWILKIDPLGSPGSPLLSYPQLQADCLFNSPSSINFFAFSWGQKRNAVPQAWFGSILKISMNLIFIHPREPSFVCWKCDPHKDPSYSSFVSLERKFKFHPFIYIFPCCYQPGNHLIWSSTGSEDVFILTWIRVGCWGVKCSLSLSVTLTATITTTNTVHYNISLIVIQWINQMFLEQSILVNTYRNVAKFQSVTMSP